MNKIEGKTFAKEREFYNSHNIELTNCAFQGEEDGESAFKESSNIRVISTLMDLRYPFWHDDKVNLKDVTMTKNCRAALWYSDNIIIKDSKLEGIKALRECTNTAITNTFIDSPEFGWRSQYIDIKNSDITSEYAFFESKDIKLDNVTFSGKYSFQYVTNLHIINSTLTTKDAFWHAKNVYVKDSIINGEYLGWYSENLTFENCKIVGTQPLCYCKNLRLINCTMVNCDLAFEYSEVNATINSDIDSIKNPYKGQIICDEVKEIIITKDSKYPVEASIIERKKQ